MVTAVPMVPAAGVRDAMTGGFTVNVLPAELPTWLVTTTGPVVAPTGTVQVMLVLDHKATGADILLNVTVPWFVPKFVPFIVTAAPMTPLAGVREVIADRGLGVKVAETVLFAAMVTVQIVPFTEVQSFHEAKVELGAGSAVRVTELFKGYAPVHVLPLHVSLPLSSVTVPDPVPAFVTVRVFADTTALLMILPASSYV